MLLLVFLRTTLATAETDPWAPFDLSISKADGTTIYYMPSLNISEDRLHQAIVNERRVVAGRVDQLQWLEDHRNQVIGELNSVLGHEPTTEQLAQQHQMLSKCVSASPLTPSSQWKPLKLYIVSQTSIK